MDLIEKYLGNSINEMASKFASEIERAKKDKNRLINLKDTIEDMMHGDMISKSDAKKLMQKAEKYMSKL